MTVLAIAFSTGGLVMPAATAAVVSWRGVVLAGAVLAAVTAAGTMMAPAVPTRVREASLGSISKFFRQRRFALFCALLICGAANEGALAGWTSSYLTVSGFTPMTATVGLSSHWLGLLVGRLLFASRVDRDKRLAIVSGALASAAIVLAMIVAPAAAVLAIGPFSAGLAIAVIVPTSLALAGDRYPGNAGTLFGLLLTMAQVGGMTLPPLIGVVAQVSGLRLALLLAVANELAIAAITWRAGRSDG
jgi:fucose permease